MEVLPEPQAPLTQPGILANNAKVSLQKNMNSIFEFTFTSELDLWS